MSSVANAVSLLFVPGHRPERFAKALASGCDTVIVDLEDAVAPADKASAAQALRNAWLQLEPSRVALRINACGTPWFDSDVRLATLLRPAAVLVPKAESPSALAQLRATLDAACPLIALIETARGLAAVQEIAASEAVARLAFGPLDLQADLGLRCGDDERELDAARFALVLASRLADLPAPIDGPTLAFDDAARLAADAERSLRMGFGGKLCIHPAQLASVHAAFMPGADEIEHAQRVVAAARDGGAVQLDGKMIDRPVVMLAQRVLARARRCSTC